jgi:cell division protein FtsW (lipid II flippase)/cell division protein FtsI/penicillin-binding protein 2
MAITRSWEPRIALRLDAIKPPVPAERRLELRWLIAASLMITAGLYLTFLGKTQHFRDEQAAIDRGALLNLNSVSDAVQVVPFLQVITDPLERGLAADRIESYVRRARPLPNVGALARLQPRLPLARLKPLFIVRTPRQFVREFVGWITLYFAAFYVVHFAWRWRRFRGDGAILPALHLATGIGLMLAVSLRDPLRDMLEFSKFAWGVAVGCGLLLLPLLRAFDYRKYTRLVYTPLLAALVLFGLLLRFGSGPTGSDSKVNLGPFQPVEGIKILIVIFMAGYFARRWEWLREVRERRLLPRWLWGLDLPRVAHTLPVMCAVACALVMFFLLKDLGPALVTGFLFLAMFAIARGRAGLAFIGIALVVCGVSIGYHAGRPPTVVDRISMWLSPWNNEVRGGDQLAHSLWALSTGGPLGSGPGLGDTGMIPAGHTDLVLPAIGEEWGVAGVITIGLLFALLFQRAVRTAIHAPDEYATFLALGFATLVALEMLLISGGVLGLIPLSGVVSPFLSFGNTAMLANFLIFAIILGISSRRHSDPVSKPFVRPARWLSAALGFCALTLVARAAYIQVFADQALIARDAFVIQEDGVKRPQHNPRLNSLARELTRGSIFDRNGVLLACSRWSDLESQRATYEQLGVSFEKNCSQLDNRYYPFGPVTAHLLGDLRTGEKFHASNASLIEHDQNAKLQGFGNIRDLAPFVRYRHRPGNADIAALRARDRSIHTSIDIRLQLRAAEILDRRLRAAGKEKGALVTMNAQTGDVLAMVSSPEPSVSGHGDIDELLDRARYGQYPPGSTFKLVTAIAALRVDPDLKRKTFHCGPLGGGRVGTRIPGWNRPIRDDIGDSAHGSPGMARAITVSCNAYFAQLGVFGVGAKALAETAAMLEIPTGDPAEFKQMLPFSAYGQGPVLITPFKMARVAATIANQGLMPQGRWVLDDSNSRVDSPRPIVASDQADFIAAAMRSVALAGTARHAMAGLNVSVAGKTGTAQVDEGEPHSWFAGFAPFDAPVANRIAFAVVVEHGGYGARAAAPIARELVEAARDLGMIAGIESGDKDANR